MSQQQLLAAQIVGGTGNLTVAEADTSPTVASVTSITVSNGTLTDNGSGSVTLTTGGGTPTELQVTVYNASGFTIPKGTPVSVDGGISGAPAVYKSRGTDGAHVLGVATANIANGATGTVQRQGVVSNFDTSGLTANFPAYVDNSGNLAALPGTYQKWVGYTLTVHATTGSIFVAPDDSITFAHGHYSASTGGTLSYAIVSDVLQFGESTDPGASPVGYQYLWVDSVDHKLKRTNSAGTTTIIG